MDPRVKKIVESAKRMVFFGGAGVSTESGIPDFRSESGLYNAMQEYGRPPETMLSHDFFMQETRTFFDYYKKNLIYKDAKPNKAHLALARLESEGHLAAISTQNIDGLHQKAGSKKVYELHGSVQRNSCMKCGAKYSLDFILDEKNNIDGIPVCPSCGGIIKPDVVLYGEMLDENEIQGTVEAISNADVLMVGGTSLAVYPAASFVRYFRGNTLILINKSETALDKNADLVIREPIGEVLGD